MARDILNSIERTHEREIVIDERLISETSNFVFKKAGLKFRVRFRTFSSDKCSFFQLVQYSKQKKSFQTQESFNDKKGEIKWAFKIGS